MIQMSSVYHYISSAVIIILPTIYLKYVISISMIDLQAIHAATSAPKNCHFMTYVCLEQAETLDYLNFLKISENSASNSNGVVLSFNSEADENSKTSKKTKNFSFDDIYRRTEKFKHQFGKLIRDVAIDALKGENQTFFIYGTEQTSKDKILFGQSQNSGLFLCVLSQIFDICHQKCLENEITLKFSCSLFNKAEFIDVFGGAGINQIQFSKDPIEGGVLHNIPQIIIRNIKTGLKLLNIVLKQVNDLREQQLTQNIFLTLKLQIDCQKNREETLIYGISRLNFVKLANPSVNSSLKGVNKNNVWFVNMLNYLQGLSISSHGCNQNSQKCGEKYDDFTEYLKEIVFKNCHKIFGFISITNKMTSNQCLTALLFSNHLKNCNSNYRYFILNLPGLSLERNKFLANLVAAAKNSPVLLQILIQYYELLNKYMCELNYLQFQYSIVIGQACQRLSKYIFTQQLQDFYYAKRTSIEKSQQLQQTYSNVSKIKSKLKFVQKKIMQKFGQKFDKKNLHQFLDLEFSMVHHFLITNLEQTIKELEDALDQFRSQSENDDQVKEGEEPVKIQKQQYDGTIKINGKQIMKSMDKKVTHKQNMGRDHQSGKHQKNCHDKTSRNTSKKEMHRSIDNLQSMFKNKNVGLVNRTIK